MRRAAEALTKKRRFVSTLLSALRGQVIVIHNDACGSAPVSGSSVELLQSGGQPVDCSDVFKETPRSKSGVYSINPLGERFSVQAYCDMDTDGGKWTVIQRRVDGMVNFYRGWDQYVAGFGDAGGEHWLGLMFIHKITAKRPQELLVEMEDFEGNKASARYSPFSVGSECDGYRLTASGFIDGGAAFWYGDCHNTNPNGVYCWGADSTIHAVGVEWKLWRNEHNYSLKSISFKTRPLQ